MTTDLAGLECLGDIVVSAAREELLPRFARVERGRKGSNFIIQQAACRIFRAGREQTQLFGHLGVPPPWLLRRYKKTAFYCSFEYHKFSF